MNEKALSTILHKIKTVWYEKPEVFMKEILNLELTTNQIQMIRCLQGYNNIAVKSSNSVGKSHCMGAYVLYYFFMNVVMYPDKTTKVLLTAPKFSQIRNGIYAKFKSNIETANKNLAKLVGDPKFKIFDKIPSEDGKQAMYKFSDETYVVGFSTDNINSIAGEHCENLLVVFDEAQGIKESVYSGFTGIKQSGKVKEILLGNPTIEDGVIGIFQAAFEEGSIYKQITISAFDTLNFQRTGITLDDYFREEKDPLYWRNKLDRFSKTDYRKAVREDKVAQWEDAIQDSFGKFSGLQNPISVYKVLKSNGMNVDSYEVKTRVLGEFTQGGSNQIYPNDWVKNSTDLWDDDSNWVKGEISIGIDFGRGVGKDKSAFSVVNGNKHVALYELELDTLGIREKAKELYYQYGADVIKIEKQAEGNALANIMREIGLNVAEVDVGASPGYGKTWDYFLKQKTDDLKRKFVIKRDEIWWNLRERIRPDRAENDPPIFMIYPNAMLKTMMRAGSYKHNSKYQIMASDKDTLRRRLKRSPDSLDSLLLALAEVEYVSKSTVPLENIYIQGFTKD